MATFTPPTQNEPFDPPLEQWHFHKGRTVYKSGGTWYEGTDFSQDVLAAADVVAAASRPGGEKMDNVNDAYVFLGGRVYTVSATVATELTNVVTTDRPTGYGAFIS